MKRYVEQLIEDINNETLLAKPKLSFIFNGSSNHEFYMLCEDNEDAGFKVSELLGIELFMLPNLDYLTSQEIDHLVEALTKAWHAHGMNPIFSRNVSQQVRYSQLRGYSNEKVYPIKNETVDIELCDHLPESCPFAKICIASSIGRMSCCQSNNNYRISC